MFCEICAEPRLSHVATEPKDPPTPNCHWRLMGTDDDWDRLARLDAEIYPAEDCITADDYRADLTEGTESWLLEDTDGNWLANIQIRLAKPPAGGNLGEVYVAALSVFSCFQGRGLGHEAMHRLLAGWGARLLVARCRQDNRRALSLLKKYGFRVTREEQRGETPWLWVRRDPQRTEAAETADPQSRGPLS